MTMVINDTNISSFMDRSKEQLKPSDKIDVKLNEVKDLARGRTLKIMNFRPTSQFTRGPPNVNFRIGKIP